MLKTELSLIKREKKVASRSKKEEKQIKLTKNKLQDKQKQRDKRREDKCSSKTNKTKQKIATAAHVNRVWMLEWMETIRKVCASKRARGMCIWKKYVSIVVKCLKNKNTKNIGSKTRTWNS